MQDTAYSKRGNNLRSIDSVRDNLGSVGSMDSIRSLKTNRRSVDDREQTSLKPVYVPYVKRIYPEKILKKWENNHVLPFKDDIDHFYLLSSDLDKNRELNANRINRNNSSLYSSIQDIKSLKLNKERFESNSAVKQTEFPSIIKTRPDSEISSKDFKNIANIQVNTGNPEENKKNKLSAISGLSEIRESNGDSKICSNFSIYLIYIEGVTLRHGNSQPNLIKSEFEYKVSSHNY